MNTPKLFLLLLFIWSISNTYADIIPENSHYVNKCVKITNLDEYENVSLLGYIWYVGNYHEDTYVITSDECLTKGYKFNTLRIFALRSDYIVGKDIDAMDLPNDANALETNLEIDPYEGYYHDSIPIDRIEEYYKILGFTESSLVVFKWKEVIGYNDGSPDSTINYVYSGDIESLSQDIFTGIKNYNEVQSDIKVYPNPAGKYIKSEISSSYSGMLQLRLISPEGRIVRNQEILKLSQVQSVEISTLDLAKGVYILSISMGDAIVNRRIVIE